MSLNANTSARVTWTTGLPSGDFTIEGWFRPLAYSGITYQSFFQLVSTTSSHEAWLGIQTTGQIVYFYYNGGGVENPLISGSQTTWRHCAISRSGSSLTIRIREDGTDTYTTIGPVTWDTSALAQVSLWTDTYAEHAGSILARNFRWHSTALSDANLLTASKTASASSGSGSLVAGFPLTSTSGFQNDTVGSNNGTPTGTPTTDASEPTFDSGSGSITLTGIASTEAFGTASLRYAQSVTGSGIASAEAFGSSAVAFTGPILVGPVSNREGWFSENATVAGWFPNSTAKAWFSSRIAVNETTTPTLLLAGIASTETFGTSALQRGAVSVTTSGIASAEAFGSSAVQQASVRPTGIASANAFGTAKLNLKVSATGIATANAFGGAVVVTGLTGHQIVVASNSLGAGSGGSGAGNHLVGSHGLAYRLPGLTVVDQAAGGRETSYFVTNWAGTILPLASGTKQNWILVWESQNQIENEWMGWYGWPGTTPEIAIANEIARLETLASLAHAAGWKIIVANCLPLDEHPLNAHLATFSAALLSSTAFDHIYDIRGDLPAFTPPGSTNNSRYFDLVHFTDQGYDESTDGFVGAVATAIAGSDLTVVPMGIASAQAFGTAKLNLKVVSSGIATANAFGSAKLNLKVSGAGIASAESFGTSTLQRGAVSVGPSGIATAGAFGSALLNAGGSQILTTGIASGEAFGTAQLNRGAVSVTTSGIASANAFGSPALQRGTVSVTTSGIATANVFGSVVLNTGGSQVITSGIASANAFGSSAVQRGSVSVTTAGIASATVFGTTTVSAAGSSIATTGIASAGAFGSPAVQRGTVNVAPTGIPSGALFGAPKVNQQIQTAGLSGGTLGTPALQKGAVNVSASSIPSGGLFGSPAVNLANQYLTLGGIPSGEVFGALGVAAFDPQQIVPIRTTGWKPGGLSTSWSRKQ